MNSKIPLTVQPILSEYIPYLTNEFPILSKDYIYTVQPPSMFI
ncbi:hypothetical protein ERICIV_04165 [Paenibacillus larvae subsp. larvae]|uniref:Uncharacterized protein n=1 Tax=Paenibacillus larvae subsp. larvae TaxID=147375 RepID=A0A2L1UJ96_9BACL|nr:hypothetical protein ERICIII_04421 [Paenibacillus larvae subsp. larvae]AVF32984.1 hypothetical protein ERICIV_04165 [Paenibacillus larvae subsp. larvae]